MARPGLRVLAALIGMSSLLVADRPARRSNHYNQFGGTGPKPPVRPPMQYHRLKGRKDRRKAA